MQVERLSRLGAIVDRLDNGAVALAEMHVPVTGRRSAKAQARALLSQAAADAQEAAALVRDTRLPTAALDAAARAVGAVTDVPIQGTALSEAANRLGSAVDELRPLQRSALADARVDEEGPQALVDGLLGRHPDYLEKDDWRALSVALEKHHDSIGTPSAVSDAPPLAQLAADIADGRASVGPTVQEYFDVARARRLTPDELAIEADEHLARHVDDLDADEWANLSALLADERSIAAVPSLPRDLPGARPLHELLLDARAGDMRDAGMIQRYFDAHAVRRLTPSELTARAAHIRDMNVEELTREDWRHLAAMLSDDRGSSALRELPRTVRGADPIEQIARDIFAAARAPDETSQRYFDAWRAASLSPKEVTASARELLSRPPEDLFDDEWATLAALLQRDRDGTLIDVPRKLPGSKPFPELARGIGQRARTPEDARRYFDAWHVRSLTPEQLTAEAEKLLSSHSAHLDQLEWSRLASYLEADPGAALVTVPRQLPGQPSFAQLVRRIAEGQEPPGATTQRYFDAWAARRLSKEELAEAGRSFATRDVHDMYDDDWVQLGALLDADTSGTVLGAPVRLKGMRPFRQIVDELGSRAGRRDDAALYLRAWRVSSMSPAERAAEADRLVSLGLTSDYLDSDDWLLLGALLDTDPAGQLIRIPRRLDGVPPLRKLVTDLAYSDAEIAAGDRYLQAAEAMRMSPARQLVQAERLLSRHSSELSEEDWGVLSSLLDADVDATTIPLVRKLPHARSINSIAATKAWDIYDPVRGAQRYFDAWQGADRATYEARVAQAVDDVAAGGLDDVNIARLAAEHGRIRDLVRDRAPNEQLRVALALLRDDRIAGTKDARAALELIRDVRPREKSLPPDLQPAYRRAVRLLNRNLGRLDGVTPRGAARGYGNHPDYAELGRLRANFELIDQATRTAAKPAAAPAPTGAPAVHGTELLTW